MTYADKKAVVPQGNRAMPQLKWTLICCLPFDYIQHGIGLWTVMMMMMLMMMMMKVAKLEIAAQGIAQCKV